MPDVVTPFDRKQSSRTIPTDTTARHRREGDFDEDGQWHDADSPLAANG